MPDMLYEKHLEGHYAIFTMNRPERLNAQGAIMAQDLEAALQDFTNDPEMRVGIVTGAGRAFSAGADLREMTERNTAMAEVEALAEQGEITPEERIERLRPYQRRGVATASQGTSSPSLPPSTGWPSARGWSAPPTAISALPPPRPTLASLR